MQPEERQKNQSTLRMCRVTGDSDKGAQKRPSLIILGQRYYYPLQAQNHTFRVAYDQQKVEDLEKHGCNKLLTMTQNTSSPSARGKKSDNKATLIFKVVCGPYHLPSLCGHFSCSTQTHFHLMDPPQKSPNSLHLPQQSPTYVCGHQSTPIQSMGTPTFCMTADWPSC